MSWLLCVGPSSRVPSAGKAALRSGARAPHCGCSCGRAQALGTRAPECALRSCSTGLSCPAACGVVLEQRLNLCPPHWQVGSHPRRR